MPNVTGQPRVTGGIPGGGAALSGSVAATATSTVRAIIVGEATQTVFTIAANSVLLAGSYDVEWESALAGDLVGGRGVARLLIDIGGGFVQQGNDIGETPAAVGAPNQFNQTTPLTIVTPVTPDVQLQFSDLGAGAWTHELTIVKFLRRS